MVSVAYEEERIQGDRMKDPRMIESVRTNAIVIGKALRIEIESFKQNLLENYTKSTKTGITKCKTSKFFRESMPPDPLKLFLIINQLQTCFTEKLRSNNVEITSPPFQDFSLRH